MPCPHRYLDLHEKNSLFPNWKIDHLFIGTFNPKWDRPNKINAAYFYGRSAYFWNTTSIFFEDREYAYGWNDQDAMIKFSQKHRIGFTDLICSIQDADENKKEHLEKIYSVADKDLETFKDIKWNTDNIISYIRKNRPANIHFTLLSGEKSMITSAIEKIEQEIRNLGLSSGRLHTPTGSRVGEGTPRLHQLVERWAGQSTLPKINLNNYPYILNGKTDKQKKQKGNNKLPHDAIQVVDKYLIWISLTKTCYIQDLHTGQLLKALAILKDEIIPFIKKEYGYEIQLLSETKNKTPRTSQYLGKLAFDYLKSKRDTSS